MYFGFQPPLEKEWLSMLFNVSSAVSTFHTLVYSVDSGT